MNISELLYAVGSMDSLQKAQFSKDQCQIGGKKQFIYEIGFNNAGVYGVKKDKNIGTPSLLSFTEDGDNQVASFLTELLPNKVGLTGAKVYQQIGAPNCNLLFEEKTETILLTGSAETIVISIPTSALYDGAKNFLVIDFIDFGG